MIVGCVQISSITAEALGFEACSILVEDQRATCDEKQNQCSQSQND